MFFKFGLNNKTTQLIRNSVKRMKDSKDANLIQLENDYLRKRIDLLESQVQCLMRILKEHEIERPKFTQKDRISLALIAKQLIESTKKLGLRKFESFFLMKPETALKWFRDLNNAKHNGTDKIKKRGRPFLFKEKEDIVVNIARENSSWGYKKIKAEAERVGVNLCRKTIRNIIKRNNIPVCGKRSSREGWRTINRDVNTWATDLFKTMVSLTVITVPFYVLFFINVKTREVVITGATMCPNGQWMEQQFRNALYDNPRLAEAKHLIHDNGTLYTHKFDEIAKSEGIKIIKTTPYSPDLNPFAERFVRTFRAECAISIIPFGTNDLRTMLKQYQSYYNYERPHQGIGNQTPLRDIDEHYLPPQKIRKGKDYIVHERLSGRLKAYYPAC